MIFPFEFKLNKKILLNEWNKVKNNLKEYDDERLKESTSNWKIVKHKFDYADELSNIFNVNARQRFYLLDANTTLGQHTDHGTLCSLNFILNNNTAPINFNGTTIHYKNALIDTTKLHGVNNNDCDRLLFKMSIFDETFEQVKNKLIKNPYINEI